MMGLPLLFLFAQGVLTLSVPDRRDNPSTSSPIVTLDYATYEGTRLAAGVDQYLGMRYAEPPLADLRFRAPKDPNPVSGTQNATSFGPICIGYLQQESSSIGEDCLFVNVFKPSDATDQSKLPVWLYIQGGGYRNNADSNYNGTKVIQESGNNLVLVNFNYRVSSLGFLASEKVRANGDLNVGLLDQRKLLRWVKKYISKFGGDPDHVVIHGLSAGAGSVSHHLIAYGGRDDHLFIGAAAQSTFWPTERTVAENEFQYDRLVKNSGCSEAEDSLACLRSLDLSTLTTASTSIPFPGANDPSLELWYWLPVIDGDLIQQSMYKQFEDGKFVKVPLLVTNVNDEGTSFANNATSPSEVAQFLQNNYPNLKSTDLDRISEAYPLQAPLPRHAAYFPSAAAAYGDATFTCPGNEMADTFARHFDSFRVWNYRFNVLDPEYVAAGIGVPHSVDKSAIFGIGYAGDAPPSFSTTNEQSVLITMDYWISFVRSLDPNNFKADDAPLWEPWGSGSGQRLRIETNATGMESIPKVLVAKCTLWRELSGNMET